MGCCCLHKPNGADSLSRSNLQLENGVTGKMTLTLPTPLYAPDPFIAFSVSVSLPKAHADVSLAPPLERFPFARRPVLSLKHTELQHRPKPSEHQAGKSRAKLLNPCIVAAQNELLFALALFSLCLCQQWLGGAWEKTATEKCHEVAPGQFGSR